MIIMPIREAIKIGINRTIRYEAMTLRLILILLYSNESVALAPDGLNILWFL